MLLVWTSIIVLRQAILESGVLCRVMGVVHLCVKQIKKQLSKNSKAYVI